MPHSPQAFWLSELSAADAYTRWTFSQFADELGSRVLEVGCGTGNFTVLLAAAVSELWALDIDAGFADETRERTRDLPHVEVRTGEARALAGSPRFDTVVLLDVLEHVADDVGLLADLRERLGPGGRLILKVPAIPAIYNEMDRVVGHHRRYDRRGLESALRDAGFGPIRTWGFNLAGVPGWWLTGGVLGHTVPSSERIRTFNRLVPVFRRIERLVRPRIGLSLFSIAAPDGK